MLTAARAGERTGAATHVEAGARPVRVALLLAQLHVEPRVEQAAEDRAHDRHGMEVGDPARQPAVADPDLGLDRARPVDDADDADRRSTPVSTIAAARRATAGARATTPNRRSAIADDILAAEVATDDERRPRRVERPLVDARGASAGVEPLDGLARPARRPVVGRVGGVDRADERLLGTTARIGLCLEEVVQALVAESFDLGLREGRAQQDLGHELERRLEPGGRHVDRRRVRASQPASAWSEAPRRSAASTSAIAS